MSENQDDLITVQHFAEQFGVGTETVREWVKKGYINFVLVGPRKMKMISKSEAVHPLIEEDPVV